MKHQRIIAWLLIATALLVVSAMLLHIDAYWFLIDILVILVCSGSGIFLLRDKKQSI